LMTAHSSLFPGLRKCATGFEQRRSALLWPHLKEEVIHWMNQKRTRVPLPHPPPYRQSRIAFWLTVLVGVLIAFLIAASTYLIVHSLISGSITTWNRTGPRHTYTLAQQPRMFWFEIVSQCVGTLFLIAVGWIGLWIHRMAREPGDKQKAKRTRG